MAEHGLDLLRLEPPPQPWVTATAACFGFRPVANAFGTSLSTTAIRGFGRFAIAQRRSTIAWSSGASLRRDDLGTGRAERELVGGVVLEEGEADDDHEHPHDPRLR